ncbi:MAG: HAD family hydrolase [Halothiobacillaceae bacterium]|nr:HAD family hydrolase [Halothiobacillaceae bacterium]
MSLAIFDLDNTLLAGDSDYLWGQFLVDTGVVDRDRYEEANRTFYEAYKAGTLDIDAFLRFSLRPLSEHEPDVLWRWREQFVREKIEPIILPQAQQLVESHRARGHTLLIITATNHFVTEPIAARFGVDELLATRPAMRDGRYTGDYLGIPTFQEGKVRALHAWLAQSGCEAEETWFYSDSRNDIPLLEQVTHPVAVDPDEILAHHAHRQGWPVISLRD